MPENKTTDAKAILLSMLGNMAGGVLAIGFKGEILVINEAASLLLSGQREPSQLLSKNVLEYLDEDSRISEELRESLKEGRKSFSLIKESINDRYLNIHGNLFIRGLIVSFEDVTEVVNAENEILKTQHLQEKNKALEQFAYVTAHDLKQPLTTIQGYLDIVNLKFSDSIDPDLIRYCSLIQNATTRMVEQIQGLLLYSRLGKSSEKKKVSLQKLVKQVLEELNGQMTSTRAKIIVEELPELEAHDLEMRSLFKNLLSNSMKYTKKGVAPEIVVTSDNTGDHNKIVIRDNGLGIDAELHDKIFEMHFRTPNSAKDYSGSGIGLAHCKKIVELHGGEIWVNSELGKGSEFHFTLSN